MADWYDDVLYGGSEKPKRVSSPPPSDFSGIFNTYSGIKKAYKMIKRMHQQTKKVPTDDDEILRRAKTIKAKKKRELQVRRARDIIIQNNAEKERIQSKKSRLTGLRRLLGH